MCLCPHHVVAFLAELCLPCDRPSGVVLCVQVKSLSSLGWFLSIGTFGQLFAALVVVYKLVMNPWVGATTEMVHNGEYIECVYLPDRHGCP